MPPTLLLIGLLFGNAMDSSLPTTKWTIGGDLNMVERSSDRDGGVGSVISSLEKQAWSWCKVYLHMFDPICGKRYFNYGVGSDGATPVKADIRVRGDWITCMGLRMGGDSLGSSNQLMCGLNTTIFSNLPIQTTILLRSNMILLCSFSSLMFRT